MRFIFQSIEAPVIADEAEGFTDEEHVDGIAEDLDT
jgi:hypothetical protein